MTTREETGACLRALRALRGWSQRQAAAAARLPPTRLSDYESGKTSPPSTASRRSSPPSAFPCSPSRSPASC
jgi:hypothetical protein